jgi:hypothetical protein
MALTRQEIYQRRKERLKNDPAERQKVNDASKKYHQKNKNNPEYIKKRSDYNKENLTYFNKKQKEYNSKQPFLYAFKRLKLRAKQNNLNFNISVEYLEQIWTGTCAIFGTPLCIPYSTKHQDPNKATVDKIIPELGYIIGNICWVSNKANIIKSFGTLEDHQLIVNYIKKHTIDNKE